MLRPAAPNAWKLRQVSRKVNSRRNDTVPNSSNPPRWRITGAWNYRNQEP